jgi:threonine/homoserine/homoserine lactone efflux protein
LGAPPTPLMQNLIALCIATAILVAIPGPNVALIVANSLRYGPREGTRTVLGTTLGVALQLGLVVLGMAVVIEFAAIALTWIKWAGVAYLLYLGVRVWRQPARDLGQVEAAPAVFWRACVIAAMNPKTLLFNAAFLPQFLPESAGTAGFAVVAGLFLSVLLLGDLLWVLFASSARRMLGGYSRICNRLTGGFLVAAGIGLALSRRTI